MEQLYREMKPEEFENIAVNHPNDFFLVILPVYEGGMEAMIEIENTLYTPGTLENDKFNLIMMTWPDDIKLVMPIAMFYMPMADKEKVELILKNQKPQPFRIIDGVPQMSRPDMTFYSCNREMMSQKCLGPACDCDRWFHWPVKGTNVYQLGYEVGKSSFIVEMG